RPASGFGRRFRWRLLAAAVAAVSPFAALRLHLLDIGSGEIDRIEQERREAAAADGVRDDLAREGKDQPWRLDQKEGLQRVRGHVADAEEAAVAEVHHEVHSVVGP